MSRARRSGQRGAVLFIALIVLVAMSLAGIALIRGVDTANLIAGNLAFKQGATHGGDWGVEQARLWLGGKAAADLYNDAPTDGYWAAMQTGLDFTATDPSKPDFDWLANSRNLGGDPGGNPEVRVVIHRMCTAPGPVASTSCVSTSLLGTSGQSQVGATLSQIPLASTTQVYYRITARVTGPRNTVSYVQVMVN